MTFEKQVTSTRRGLPRLAESILASGCLLAALPLIAFSALAIALTSRGPVIFAQWRIGRNGRKFRLFKLRTMRVANSGLGFTASDDSRVTPIGRLLRKAKLDELPGLWNVVKGDMSFVGPRPEVPEYVDLDDPLWRAVLEVRPGITHPVTTRLRNEEDLLSAVGGDRLRFYSEVLQPYKLNAYVEYLSRRSWITDLQVIAETAAVVLFPRRSQNVTEQELLAYTTRK